MLLSGIISRENTKNTVTPNFLGLFFFLSAIKKERTGNFVPILYI